MKIINLFAITAIGVLILAGCGTGASSRHQSLLTVSAENLQGLDDSQWSAVKEIDGRKARVVTGRDTASFIVPAWWGNSARPGDGEIFVLEIDYQDAFSAPFIVYSFGNSANSRNQMSELHRIAGESTAGWKTAYVPVSWDYLFAGAGAPSGAGNQAFGIKLGDETKELPVSEIRIRKAAPGDESRYNAETRAWIKKSQEKYEFKDSSSTAVLPDAWNTKSCVPYLRDYLSPILPWAAPREGEAGATMKLRMSLNEIESKQLGVYANGKDLENVSINVSGLKNEAGEALNAETNLYTVEYALIKARGNRPPQVDAQRIWPLFETPVKAGRSQAFWLSFKTKQQTAKPGLYKGEISVLVQGKPAEKIPLEIEVMPVSLLTMDESGLSMGGCVTGFIPFHNITYAVENNVNAINLWFSSTRPPMSKADGKLKLDFTLMDEWMKKAKQLGMQNIVYFLGGNPYGFPKTMTIEQELFVTMQDEGTRDERVAKFLKLAADPSNRGYVIKEIRDAYGEWVKQFTEHAQQNGWPEIILTPFDEPAKHRQQPYRKEGHTDDSTVIGSGPWIKTHFEDGCDLIRKYSAPGTRIYGSIHHPSGIEFLPKINVFCTNAIFDDPELGNKVRAGGEGKYFWQYTGVGGGGGSEPTKMRYAFGFYFGAYDSRGSLLWAYNWGGRFNTTQGNNWMICWDTPFSTIPTLSYEGLREAWDDRRYIETLRKIAKDKGREEETRIFLDDIFSQATNTKTEGGVDTVNDFWADTKSPEKLDRWRFLIADKIIELSKI